MDGPWTLEPYQDAQTADWDQVVRDSKTGSFVHQRRYLSYHEARFDDASLVIRADTRPVAVFPAHREGERIISHAGLPYAGLLYGAALHGVEVLRICDQLIEHYRGLGARSLLYRAVPAIYHRYPAEEDLYALFRAGARLVRRDLSSAVRLDCRLRLSDSRRSTIRKAERGGVVIRESHALDEFHAILSDALARRHVTPTHSREELVLLASRCPDEIRLFGAFRGETMLAGALVYDFGEVVHTQYLASTAEGRALGALDAVIAHVLDGPYARHRALTFGVSTEKEGSVLNESLLFQKEGFGGRGIVHDHYLLDL